MYANKKILTLATALLVLVTTHSEDVRAGSKTSVPDVAWDAMKERNIIVFLNSGQEQRGKLAGISADSVTLIDSAGEVIVLSKADVVQIRAAVAAASSAPQHSQGAVEIPTHSSVAAVDPVEPSELLRRSRPYFYVAPGLFGVLLIRRGSAIIGELELGNTLPHVGGLLSKSEGFLSISRWDAVSITA